MQSECRRLKRPFRTVAWRPRAPVSHKSKPYRDDILKAANALYTARLQDTRDELPHEPDVPAWGSAEALAARRHLSDTDNQIIEQYLILGRRQIDIATLFGVCQTAICHRLQSALARLAWWAKCPPIPPGEVWHRWFGWDTRLHMALVAEEYCKDCSQTAVAERAHRTSRRRWTQVMVRHRLERIRAYLDWWLQDPKQQSFGPVEELESMHRWMEYAYPGGAFMSWRTDIQRRKHGKRLITGDGAGHEKGPAQAVRDGRRGS